jgi:hypothetical protein
MPRLKSHLIPALQEGSQVAGSEPPADCSRERVTPKPASMPGLKILACGRRKRVVEISGPKQAREASPSQASPNRSACRAAPIPTLVQGFQSRSDIIPPVAYGEDRAGGDSDIERQKTRHQH